MNNFTFQNPTKIVFGKGSIKKLPKLISTEKKILYLYGGGSIKTNGVYEQTMEALSDHTVIEFSGIEANPQYSTCLRAIELVKKEGIDFILSVGGGSVLDAAKFIAIGAAQQSENPWNFVIGKEKISSALPIGAVLTLPATGSEMNANSVISYKEKNEKRGFASSHVYPQFSILDPETTYSLPLKQIANGVIDTFVHVTEQYLTYDVNSPLQDYWAEGILKTLITEGPKAMKNPKDYEVRANIMWASTLALNGIIGAGVVQDWATHQIGHEITALYGVDHGRTLAIVLPGLLKFKKATKRSKLLRFAKEVWGLHQGDENVLMDEAIARMDLFFQSLGAGTHLKDYNIGSDAAEIVSKKIADRDEMIGEHQDIGKDEIREILNSRA